MVMLFPSNSLQALTRPHFDDLDRIRLRARNLLGDILPLDMRLMPQRQDDRTDHRNQQHDAGRLKEIDVAGVKHVPECLRIERAPRRRYRRRDRLLRVGIDGPADQNQNQFDQKNRAEKSADRQVLSKALTQLGEINIEHHHYEQEQYQDGADIDDDKNHRQEFRAEKNEQRGRVDERENEKEYRVHGIPSRNHHDRGGDAHASKQVEEQRWKEHLRSLPVWRIESDIVGDLALPAVAIGKQPLFIEVELLARLSRKLEIGPFDDGVDWTGLLAKPAVDAFDHVDIVAGGSTRTVVAARSGLDCYRLCRTDRLAQFASDAALLAIGITAQRVLAPKARREQPFLEWIIEGGLRLEEVAQAEHERRDKLFEEYRAGGLIEFHSAILFGAGFRRGTVSPRAYRQANNLCPRTR